MQPGLQVSVVVPTYNRLHLVRGCLEALARQVAPDAPWEVIVVDDGSTDGTRAALDGSSWPFPFTYLPKPNGGRGSACNLGVRHARAPWVAFVDDDCVVPSGWLAAVVTATRARAEVAGFAGVVEPIEEVRLVSRYVHRRRLFACPTVVNGRVLTLPGVAVLRRSAFEQVGGYDEWFRLPGGEDVDLGHRLLAAGETLAFEPTVVVRHHHRAGVRSLLEQVYGYGRASGLLNRKGGHRPSAAAIAARYVVAAGCLAAVPLYIARHVLARLELAEGAAYGLLDGLRKAAYGLGKARGLRDAVRDAAEMTWARRRRRWAWARAPLTLAADARAPRREAPDRGSPRPRPAAPL
jgi:glycosyltransferase involved in cell wall biosynthesis